MQTGHSYNRSSTFGFCVYLGSNLISWQSKRQHVVSRPSIEVEYKSLAHLRTELTWTSSVLSELQVPLSKPSTAWCDNLNTMLLFASPIQHSRTKHVELDTYFVP